MFAFLALAGDVGCTAGPTLVGLVTDATDGRLQTGLSFGIIFPAVLSLGLIIYMLINKRNKKAALDVPLSESRGADKEENNNDNIQS